MEPLGVLMSSSGESKFKASETIYSSYLVAGRDPPVPPPSSIFYMLCSVDYWFSAPRDSSVVTLRENYYLLPTLFCLDLSEVVLLPVGVFEISSRLTPLGAKNISVPYSEFKDAPLSAESYFCSSLS